MEERLAREVDHEVEASRIRAEEEAKAVGEFHASAEANEGYY